MKSVRQTIIFCTSPSYPGPGRSGRVLEGPEGLGGSRVQESLGDTRRWKVKEGPDGSHYSHFSPFSVLLAIFFSCFNTY